MALPTYDTTLNNNLIRETSVLNMPDPLDRLGFIDSFEGTLPQLIEPGVFGAFGSTEGVEFDIDRATQKSYIQSRNYVEGSTGWRFPSDGNGQANQLTVVGIETADTDDPLLRFKTTNTAHQINVTLDENATDDVLQIEGQTASVDTLVRILAKDGEAAQLLLYSGNTASAQIAKTAGDHLTFQNNTIDADINFIFSDGGVQKRIYVDSSEAALVPYASTQVNLGLTGSRWKESWFETVYVNNDLIFDSPGAGLPYGEINHGGSAVNTVLAAQDTWYQILNFSSDGLSNLTTPAHGTDDITISKTGTYLATYSICCRSAQSNLFEFTIAVNDGPINGTEKTNTHTHRSTTTAGRLGVVANSAIVSFTNLDTVELWVQRLDGGGASKTITFEHLTLNVTMIGG